MRNQSERESIIQYTNHLIEQNNDEIKSLKSRFDKIISNDEQRKILENIEELNQSNRRLALRLEEPMLSMIIEYKELLQKGREATTQEQRKYYSELSHKKHQEMLVEEFGGDKNIGRFNEV